VDRSDEVWKYRPESHKTEHHGRERIIYVGPKAQQVLLPYLLRDAQLNCFSPAESEAKRHEEQRARRRTRVQPSQRNRRKARPARVPRTAYTKDSYNRAITRGIEKANKQRREEAADMGIEPMLLPHWHANQLRHSKATEIPMFVTINKSPSLSLLLLAGLVNSMHATPPPPPAIPPNLPNWCSSLCPTHVVSDA
jgi:hypothetical protein